jgi:hypothetical protein
MIGCIDEGGAMSVVASSMFEGIRSPRAPRVPKVGIAAATAGLAGALALAITGLHGDKTAAAPAPAVKMALVERVVPAGMFPGFALDARPVVLRGATRWATAGEESLTPASETTRLRRLGFVAGVAEHLSSEGKGRAYGMSTVERFSSPAGARSELAAQQRAAVRAARANGQSTGISAVSEIPGATALTIRASRTAGTTVSFAYGDYYYAVGVGHPGTPQSSPGVSSVTTAANALYLQAAGCVAPRGR